MSENITVYTDGLCEPTNPNGIATWGIIAFESDIDREVKDKSDNTIIFKECGVVEDYIKENLGSSNQIAELVAIIKALEKLENYKDSEIVLRSDSQFAINSIIKNWNIKAERIVDIHRELEKKVDEFDNLKLEWVPREYNEEADSLSRRAYYNYFEDNEEAFEKYEKYLITDKQKNFMDELGLNYHPAMSKHKASEKISEKIDN